MIDDPKIGTEYHFFFYDLSSPIMSLDHLYLKQGVLVGNSCEELDIYCERQIYRCLCEDIFSSRQNAIDYLRNSLF